MGVWPSLGCHRRRDRRGIPAPPAGSIPHIGAFLAGPVAAQRVQVSRGHMAQMGSEAGSQSTAPGGTGAGVPFGGPWRLSGGAGFRTLRGIQGGQLPKSPPPPTPAPFWFEVGWGWCFRSEFNPRSVQGPGHHRVLSKTSLQTETPATLRKTRPRAAAPEGPRWYF